MTWDTNSPLVQQFHAQKTWVECDFIFLLKCKRTSGYAYSIRKPPAWPRTDPAVTFLSVSRDYPRRIFSRQSITNCDSWRPPNSRANRLAKHCNRQRWSMRYG